MTVGKPKPKQLESQSEAQASYHFQPTMNRWNSRSNLIVFTNQWSPKEQIGYFENTMAWHKPKPKPHPLLTDNFDLPVKSTPITRLFLIGRVMTHHLLEPMKKPTKTETKTIAQLLSTVIWKLLYLPHAYNQFITMGVIHNFSFVLVEFQGTQTGFFLVRLLHKLTDHLLQLTHYIFSLCNHFIPTV